MQSQVPFLGEKWHGRLNPHRGQQLVLGSLWGLWYNTGALLSPGMAVGTLCTLAVPPGSSASCRASKHIVCQPYLGNLWACFGFFPHLKRARAHLLHLPAAWPDPAAMHCLCALHLSRRLAKPYLMAPYRLLIIIAAFCQFSSCLKAIGGLFG